MTTIARTIFAQLCGSSSRLAAMTGARAILTEDRAISFKLPRFSGCPWNYCRIELDASDTYTVRFAKLTKLGEVRKDDTFPGVYCDQLQTLFEAQTGLYLSI